MCCGVGTKMTTKAHSETLRFARSEVCVQGRVWDWIYAD